MDTARKFKKGDRVVNCGGWDRNKAGTVIRDTARSAVTVLVKLDGRDKEERIQITFLRLETKEDVVKQDHNKALNAWRDSRPQTAHAQVSYPSSSYGMLDPCGAEVARCKTPEDMRKGAAELLEIAAWYERRPKGDVD